MNLRPGNIHKRIADIFGKKLSQSLLPVDVKTSICNIYGFVGKPECAKKKCSMQYFFVNGRFMRHPYFSKAVISAYERLVPAGEQIPYFLYFDTDPATIDINIHPSKTEIKFENEQSIWQILSAGVREAVGVFSEIPVLDFNAEGKPDIPVFNKNNTVIIADKGNHTGYNPFRQINGGGHAADEHWDVLYKNIRNDNGDNGGQIPGIPPKKEKFAPPIDGQLSYHQHNGQYIVISVTNGLIIVDQHKAHMRVLYEKYIKQISTAQRAPQRMLFPEAVKFNACDAALLDTVVEEMENLGFELTPLGANTYAINAIPTGLEGINPSSLLSDMMEDVILSGSSATDEIYHSLALSLARKAAIPYGQILADDEIKKLITELFNCENINYTPDGKKTFVVISEEDNVRQFS